MKPAVVLLSLILSSTFQFVAFAEEPFHALWEEVLKVLRTKYSDVTLSMDRSQPAILAFSHKMREFVIYRLNKTGDWQKPMNVQAPDRGGLSVRFYVQKGPWEGALVVPYSGTSDLYVFKETHIVKNSADGNWHIWAEVLTPKVDSPEELAGKLVKLFNDFEKYR